MPALFAALEQVNDHDDERLEKLIARAGNAALSQLLERYEQASLATRVRLLRIATRCDDARALELFLRAIRAESPLEQRWAARGLGRSTSDDLRAESALLEAFRTGDLPLRRAIAEALGKVGGEAALAELALLKTSDAELERRVERSLLMLARSKTRADPSRILLDVPLPRPVALVARTRPGLAAITESELIGFEAVRRTTPEAVEFRHSGTLRALYVARTALEFAFRIAFSGDEPSPEAVADSLCSEGVSELLQAWTEGPWRFRLSYATGGHRRADVWKVAELVSQRNSGLYNDSRAASWEVVVGGDLHDHRLLLVPKAFEDPRFGYRKAEVRAASHPTLAAALARVAGSRTGDVVWDPFVGSGLELVERAMLGPYAQLIGSDIDPVALDAARTNLAAAGVSRVRLEQADALRHELEGVTLIITNPPMGRRVARDGSLAGLLLGFVENAGRVLGRGGRLVWLSPLPELTAQGFERAGLALERVTAIDMGGFSAEIQVGTKR
ncbi:MAG TPA: HEAT repeat domain-containing protein [Polyangiaceae bacterium]|nr:HEAT repeat domain-containing protein [Polyangiaceae bacterium]